MATPATQLTIFSDLTPPQSGVSALDTNFELVGSGATVYGGIATGTANALSVSIVLDLPDYYVGMSIGLVAASNNTAAPTLTVETPTATLATIPITDQSGTPLGANGLVAGNVYVMVLVSNASNTLSFRVATNAAAPVSSVFGRTGAVVATSGDYSIGQITGAGTIASQAANSVAITGGAITGVVSVARAWVNFVGTGSVGLAVITKSYNVTSVNKTGTGGYTIQFTSSLADSHYVVIGTTAFTSVAPVTVQAVSGSATTSNVNIVVYQGSGGLYDAASVYVVFFD